MPSTRSGCLSLLAFGLFWAFLLLFFAGVVSGQKGGDTFFSNLYLALTILAAGTCGIGAGLLALFAVVVRHERGGLIWPVMVIGLLVAIFTLGEVGGHDEPGANSPAPTLAFTPSPATGSPAPSATPTIPLRQSPTPSAIDYSAPQRYLASGSQSTLSTANIALVRTQVRDMQPGLPGVARIFEWMQRTFRTEPNGGATIGRTDVNDLLRTSVMTGCHDWGLVLSTVLRLYGYPAIMADTAGIQWALDFHAGKRTDMAGHVFVEAYVEGRWIAVNCTTGVYAANYDPSQPVLPFLDSGDAKGFFVVAKGVDPAGYGVTSGDALAALFRPFAARIDTLELVYPAYEFRSLSGASR